MPPTAASAYQSLQDAQKNAVTPDAAITAGNTKYGVGGISSQLDQLRGLTSNLTTSLANVDPSVRGRTSGSLVTEAQRQAITNNEQQPIVSELNKTGQQVSDTADQFNRATGLATNYANSLLQSDKDKYNALFGQYTSLTQQEQAAADAAERKREFDATLADSQAARKAAASAAGTAGLSLGGGDGTTPVAADPLSLARGAAKTQKQLLLSENLVQPYARERVLQSLQRQFPNVNPQDLHNIVFNEIFTNGWENGAGQHPASQSVQPKLSSNILAFAGGR